ncbi:MAG: GGDEF domain-containing protein [Chloroflexi bacterium]|nr:GGDEF domain-containing protein [Chloroflexota bacterium]
MKFDLTSIEGRLPGKQERRYRMHFLTDDVKQATWGILLIMIPLVFFAYNDYLFYHFTSTFYNLVIIRSVCLIASIVTVVALHKVKNPTGYDWIVFSWAVAGTLALVLIQASRPVEFVQSFFVDMLVIIMFFVVIPSGLLFRMGAALILTSAEILALLAFKEPLSQALANTVFFTFITGNFAGFFISIHMYRQRRNEFKILEEEVGLQAEIARMAEIDELTGLYNRRKFLELAEKEVIKCRRYERPFSFMMLDLDHFKTVNDTYGHQAGDKVLMHFADLVKNQLRNIDILGRLGGEEFGIVLVETHLNDAWIVAERIRQTLATEGIRIDRETSVNVTVSIGLTEVSNADCMLDHVISQADTALYKVKKEGRDKVEVFVA